MRVIECVGGVVLIVAAGMRATEQLVMLARRRRSAGVWHLVSLPAAGSFRIAVLCLAEGVVLLEPVSSAEWWVAVGLWTAILAWHCGLWLQARLLRHRPRSAG